MRDAPFARSSVRMSIELILLLLSLFLISPTVSGVQFVSPTFDYPPLGELNTPGVYQHVFALFGPDPDTYNTTAPLWYDPLAPTFCHPSSDATIKGKIVLAQRDSACDFATRARNAADMGAVGLIIGDNKYSQQFDVHWMGPPQIDPPMVNIPVILILGETYQLLLGTLQTKTIDPPPYRDTIATIDQRGLFMTMDQYWESVDGLAYWDDRLRIAFNLSPFLIVALCYWAFYKTWRPLTPASPAAPAPPAGQGQQQSAPPVGAQPSQPPSRAVSAPPPRSSVTSPSSSTFSDTEMNQLNLPIPPSLSSNADGMSDVSLDVAHGGRIHDSSSLTDEHEHKENEGLMSSGIGSSSATGSHRADLASQPASLRAENQGQMLNRPLLAAPTVAPQMRLYYHLLKALSAAGKPYFILRCNALVYAIHAICGLAVLIAGWNEKCSNETYLAMVSLWCARAMIGFRICFWQCHSNTAVPTCADIFFKNWSDCVILLTGSMFSWNDAQKTDCEMRAPTIYRAIQIWTIITYITYGLRIVFYAMDRYSQRHGGSLPHIFTISARSFLTLLNGGFSCAGALDKNQPATQLDLMLIPTVTYRTGMYAADDALCAVCMCEYTPGETLRLLNCSHHFHSTCVDTWLLQKNSCPVCRQTIDQERVVRRGGASEDEIQDVQLDEEAQIPRPQPYDGDRPPSPSRIGQYDERV